MSGRRVSPALSISIGTFTARVLALVKNFVLAACIGTSIVADTYNISNAIPSLIFLVLGGGTVLAVFTPELVRLNARDTQRSDQLATLLLLVATLGGGLLSLAAILARGSLVRLYGGSSWKQPQVHLFETLAIWCLPQIGFYAVYVIQSQILNARDRFGLVAFVPVLNSVTVIVGALTIAVTSHVHAAAPSTVTRLDRVILGADTFIGTALQTVVLGWVMYRGGYRLRLTNKLRGLGLRRLSSVGVSALVSVLAFQAIGLTASVVGGRVSADEASTGSVVRSYTAYLLAQTFLFTAYAIGGSGFAQLLLQRLANIHDHAGRRRTISAAMLSVMRVVTPISVLMVVLGPYLGIALFARGQTSSAAAYFIGFMISVLALALVPYSLQALLIRPFYASGFGRYPLYSALRIATLACVLTFAAVMAPTQDRIILIGLAFPLSYFLDLPFLILSVRRVCYPRFEPEVIRALVLATSLIAASGCWLVIDAPLSRPVASAGQSLTRLFETLLVAGLAYLVITWRTGLSVRHLLVK